MAEVTAREIPFYSRGSWGEVIESDLYVEGDDASWNESVRAAGWSEFATVGNDRVGLSITVYSRSVPRSAVLPEFMFSVDGPFLYHVVAARDIADAMELLARWSPIIQQAAITTLIEDIDSPLGDPAGGEDLNLIQRIGAKFSRGAAWLDRWESAERREAEKRRRSAGERKVAGH